MSRTFGELIDRLIISNLKLWHTQDRIFKASAAGEGVDADTVNKVVNLNLERNKTMTELDKLLETAIKTGKVDVDERPKIL